MFKLVLDEFSMRFLSITLLCLLPLALACGPSVEEMERYVDDRMKHTIEGLPGPLPTVTPVSFPTPLPTATPMAIPTSVPTVTPVSFPTPLPTATPMAIPTSVPTVTPVSFPTPLPHITPTPYRWTGLWPVVRIETTGGRGNGFLISPNEVLSAYHVVQNDSSITVRIPSSNKSAEEEREATLVGFNIQDDIVLLTINPFSFSSSIDYPKFSPIPYNADGNDTTDCKKAVSNGDVVIVETTGNHATNNGVVRLWGKRSTGWVDGRRFLTDLDLAPGTSGSPIYNFAGRYLVGMVLAGSTLLSNRGSTIALDGCIIKGRLSELRSGVKN